MKRTPLLMTAMAILGVAAPASAQHPRVDSTGVVEGTDFRVYDGEGEPLSFSDVVSAMGRADAVLVGETHDDVIGHRVETRILVRGAQEVGAVGGSGGASRPVVLSLEMFERDVQYVLDEYLAGLITEDQFERSARPWDRYDTDYRPMVEFARAHGIPVVAANAPRRYVNRVSRLGPESLRSLSGLARSYLPPLPYPGPSELYTEQWNALMSEMMGEMRASTPDTSKADAEEEAETEEETPSEAPPPMHDMSNALQAQALWDASMGEAVALQLRMRQGALVIHYAGSFHVEKGTGIPERVVDYRPGSKLLTVVLQPAEDVATWDADEYDGLGDFVILTRKPSEGSGGR